MTVPADFIQANSQMLEAYAAVHAQLTGGDNQADLDKLTSIMSGMVPPERVSKFFEFGYAKADLFDAGTKAAFADIGAFATMNGFFGLNVNSRGIAMEMILRGQELPEGVDVPEPSSEFASAPAL